MVSTAARANLSPVRAAGDFRGGFFCFPRPPGFGDPGGTASEKKGGPPGFFLGLWPRPNGRIPEETKEVVAGRSKHLDGGEGDHLVGRVRLRCIQTPAETRPTVVGYWSSI
jgi:hypothetical protein